MFAAHATDVDGVGARAIRNCPPCPHIVVAGPSATRNVLCRKRDPKLPSRSALVGCPARFRAPRMASDRTYYVSRMEQTVPIHRDLAFFGLVELSSQSTECQTADVNR